MFNWLLSPADYFREAVRFPFRVVGLAVNRRLDIYVMNLLQSFLRPLSKAKLPDDSVIVYPLLNPPYGALRDIYIENVYFSEFTPQPSDTVFDVGANIGLFMIRAWNLMQQKGLVVAVEPDCTGYQFLLRNVAVNNIRALPLNVALGAINGYTEFAVSIGLPGWGTTNVRRASQMGIIKRLVQVRVLRLDTVATRLGLEKIDFLKIDTEGAEKDVLKGSSRLLKEKKIEKIVVAAYHQPKETEEVASLLTKHGYKAKICDGYVYAS